MSGVVLRVQEVLALPDDEQVAHFSELSGRSSLEEVIHYGAWLSITYSQDGHPVAPNSTVLEQAKKEHPGLPSRDQIERVAGSVATVSEALGFVTQEAARQWTREDYLANGVWLSHMLGSSEKPVMPGRKDLEFAARYKVGAPFGYVIKEFGGVAEYQDALGFVNFETVQRWTDEDWKDYGVWLSHMLGSAEEPRMPTFRDLSEASRHNIGPATYMIYEKFGDLVKYQAVLGFDVNTLDYRNWDRATYVANGIWLSHLLGTPDKPVMPIAKDIDEATALGLTPPRSAIDKRFKKSISIYQDALGFVTAATLKRWTREDWIANGIWLSHLLGSSEEPAMPSKQQLEEAAEYNLVPKRTQIIDEFGGIMEYQQALGFSDSQHYRTWTNRDFLRHGLALSRENEGKRPHSAQYDEADGPSRTAIQTRFGTLAALHERLGFPDYSHLTPVQLINFGVRWMHEHDGQPLVSSDLDTLSKSKQAPSRAYVTQQFGTLTDYKAIVEKSYEAFLNLRAEYTGPRTSSKNVVDLLLRDFEPTDEYRERFKLRMQQVGTLRASRGVKFTALSEMFGRSRVTALWDKDDFIYFRGLIQRDDDLIEASDVVDTLRFLDQVGLSPYLDEIEEVFGSLEDFANYM